MLFPKWFITKVQTATIAREIFLILAAIMICSMLYVQVQDVECKSQFFSFVQIGDVQSANETQLQSIIDFILDNKTVLDIRYVVQMGDLVEVYNNETAWKIKNAAFSQLTSVIPFGWLTGDNDGESSSYLGDNYYAFNVSNYPNMTSSYDQGRSTAQYFNFSGTEILFVNLEYFANETALQWFESLYQQYYKATVIFSTHSYLDLVGNYTEDTLNSTYLDGYPRVKLVLCGHFVYALNKETNGRTEILFNYQCIPEYNIPDFSDFVRLYTVFDDGTVNALTYSQLRDQYLTDSANQFSFRLLTPPTPTPLPTTTPSTTPSTTPTPTLPPTPSPSPTQSPPSNPSTSPSATRSSPPREPEPLPTVLAITLGASAFMIALGLLFYFNKHKR